MDKNDDIGRFSFDSDLVFWDGMYLDKEKNNFKGWGHSSVQDGLEFAEKYNVKNLLICHHSPLRKDEELTEIDITFSNNKVKFSYDKKILTI